MALQNVKLAFGILAGGVGLLGALLVFRDILFVIHHHVRREIAIELRSRHFRHLVVVGLLLGVWPVRRVGESYALVAESYGMKIPPAEVSARFRSCFGSAPPLAFPAAGKNGV